MIPLDIDMELLRRLGVFTATLEKLADADGTTDASGALASLQDRAKDAEPCVVKALAAIQSALPSDALAPEQADEISAKVATVLSALEPLMVGDAADEHEAQLATAVAGLDTGTEDPPAPSSDEEIDQSLHSVASYLIQMEPTLMQSVTALRDMFSETVSQWNGSDEVQEQLMEALGELDTLAGKKRSKKTRRVEVVERVGAAIEIAMREEEDTAFFGEREEDPEPELATSEPDDAVGAAAATEAEPVIDAAPAAVTVPDPAPSAPSRVAASEARPGSLDSDPELVSDFVAEGLDYLDQAEEALLALETNPSDQESVNVTFRAFHTIKGVSAFLELTNISGIAHEAETLLALVREGSLSFTGTAADLFLRSADVLRNLLLGVRETLGGRTPTPPPGMDQLLVALRDPELAKKVANNESLGFETAPADAEQAQAPAQAPKSTQKEATSSGGDDSVRIRTERLDTLVDLVGELVVSFSMVSQDPDVVTHTGELQKKVGHSSKIIRELQDLSTSLRMVPLKPAFHKISRVVRDVAKKSGKNVVFVSHGEETELDRSMVGIITDPLVHMVRNSIDHGVETSEERLAAGKPERGSVRLTAEQSGGNVVVTIEDDGKGLDKEKLLAKAIANGVVDAERKLSDSEIFNLVFHPGLSTAAKVTDISGRGVGMDVVKRAVESLRGRIEIESTVGKGTKFSIFLPLTLSITDGMLVRVGQERFIIPTMKIQVSLRPTREEIWSVSGRGEMVMLQGQLIPIARLHRMFGLPGSLEDPSEALLVVVGEGSRRTALLVDELFGQQQFVVKPLTGQVSDTRGVAGGAILGDGGVGLILDPEEIIEMARGTAVSQPDAA